MQVPDDEQSGRGCRIERAKEMREAKHRLLQVSNRRGRGEHRLARLGIEQDGPDDRLEVPPDARTVVIEGGGDAADVIRARIAGHQTLDQPVRKEGTDVRMVEDVVERVLEVLLRRLTRRKRDPRQEFLGGRRMVLREENHRFAPLDHRGLHSAKDVGRCPLSKSPAGEHFREALHLVLAVGRDWLAPGIELERSVGIELVKPDREQLHQLAGVVLVRLLTGERILLIVLRHVQVHPHRRAERDVLEQRTEIAERVASEQIHIGCQPEGGDTVREAVGAGDDDDFEQRVRHPLPQLIGTRHRRTQPRLGQQDLEVFKVAIELGVHVAEKRADRRPHLIVQPGAVSLRPHLVNSRPGGPHGRVCQETCRVRRRYPGFGRTRHCRLSVPRRLPRG